MESLIVVISLYLYGKYTEDAKNATEDYAKSHKFFFLEVLRVVIASASVLLDEECLISKST